MAVMVGFPLELSTCPEIVNSSPNMSKKKIVVDRMWFWKNTRLKCVNVMFGKF